VCLSFRAFRRNSKEIKAENGWNGGNPVRSRVAGGFESSVGIRNSGQTRIAD
jgi:hypothetical protein